MGAEQGQNTQVTPTEPAAGAGTPAPKAPATRPARPAPTPSKVYGTSTGAPLSEPARVEAEPEPDAQAAGAAAPAVDRPVVGHGGQLPPEKLTERLERERRRLLREEYGTDDLAKIKQLRTQRAKEADERKARDAEYATLKAAEDERARQAMSVQQRLEADLEAERKKTAALESQINDLNVSMAYREQTAQLTDIASKIVDPELLEEALERFGRYVVTLKREEVENLKPRQIERWFEKLVAEKPKYAPPKPPPEGAPPAKLERAPLRRIPVTTSAQRPGGPPKPKAAGPDAAGSTAGKVVRPGQKNTMSKQELNEHLRAKGLRPW